MTSAIPPGPRRTAAPSRSAPRFPGTPGTAPPRCRTPPVRDVAASPVPTPPAFPPSRCGPAPRTGAGAGGAPGGAEQHSVGEQQPQPRCRRGPGPAPTAHGERQLGRVPPSHPERPRRPRPRRAASRPRRDGTGRDGAASEQPSPPGAAPAALPSPGPRGHPGIPSRAPSRVSPGNPKFPRFPASSHAPEHLHIHSGPHIPLHPHLHALVPTSPCTLIPHPDPRSPRTPCPPPDLLGPAQLLRLPWGCPGGAARLCQEPGNPWPPAARKAEFIGETIAGCFLPGALFPAPAAGSRHRIQPAQPGQAPATPQGSCRAGRGSARLWGGRKRGELQPWVGCPQIGGTQSSEPAVADPLVCCAVEAAETPGLAWLCVRIISGFAELQEALASWERAVPVWILLDSSAGFQQ